MSRILGVDLGLKRTGLAVSDELLITTRALPILTPKSRAEDIAHILKLCEDLEVTQVLIGYPLLIQSG
ncbi:MAG: RuvX/YqgF family protein, partial [Myxococcaceae bacterium]